MARLLVRNAARIVTMDADRREIADGSLLIEDGVIAAVGGVADAGGAEVLDARGCVVTPGLVNTHHHLYQCLTRAVPAGQDALLFGWLKTLYPIWARMTPEDMFVSAQLGLAELALSGCTMSSDHLYLFPNGVRLEDTIEAAATIGIRFHPTRGAMSVGESAGGLPPDSLVEAEPAILADMVRVVDAFHDPSPGAMVRVGLAPCSPFSVSTGADARRRGARPRQGGDAAHPPRRERRGHRLFAGAVRLPPRPVRRGPRLDRRPRLARALRPSSTPGEIDLFARTGTGVAHCPCSNCRLGSGIAPVRQMRDAGVKVGLGVDGSASNDAGHLLAEARQAMLLQRVAERRRRDERPRGAGDRHPRRRGGARPRRRARLASSPASAPTSRSGTSRDSARPAPGTRWRRCCSAARSRCATSSSKAAGWCARGGWRASRSRPCSSCARRRLARLMG